MLKHRIPVGAALITLVLLVGWIDQFLQRRSGVAGLAFAVVAAPIFALGAIELAAMLRVRGVRLPRGLAPASAVAGLAAGAAVTLATSEGHAERFLIPLLALWAAISLIWISWPRRTDGALLGGAGAMLIFVLLGLIPSHYLVLRQSNTAWTVIALVLIAKSCDMGAFFTGKAIGRRKLIPWLSPGKTWEGLIGGIVTAAGIGALVAWVSREAMGDSLQFPLDPARAAVLGATLGLVAQFGDLSISLFKRDSGLKDASKTLPGLGGVLDVVDSLLFVAPAAHVLLLALGPGGI